MTTMELAKKAFTSRHAVDAWFKDAAPNFEAFAEMVRNEEREACANACELQAVGHRDGFGNHCAEIIRGRSNE